MCACVWLDTDPEKGFPILVVIIETALWHCRKCDLYKEKSTMQHKTCYNRSCYTHGRQWQAKAEDGRNYYKQHFNQLESTD